MTAGEWRHDLEPAPCAICGEPATTADPDGRVVHIPCAIPAEDVARRRRMRAATPSRQLQAARTLRKMTGLPVVASRLGEDGVWSLELRDGRLVVLGSRGRLKDPDHVVQVLRGAGVKRARLLRRPENAGSLLGFLQVARTE